VFPIDGQVPATKAVSGQQRRALRKLLRDLIVFTGVAAADVAVAPRKVPQRKRHRLLYGRADTLSDTDLDRLVAEIGIGRWWAAAERATQPQLPLVAAEQRSPWASLAPRAAPLFPRSTDQDQRKETDS
jgi:hypothetical protein